MQPSTTMLVELWSLHDIFRVRIANGRARVISVFQMTRPINGHSSREHVCVERALQDAICDEGTLQGCCNRLIRCAMNVSYHVEVQERNIDR